MAKKDYYELLGVSRTATEQELKSAYRKMVMKYHPDRYATKPEKEKKAAEETFKEINHAYEVLSDPKKKANYDQFGTEDGPQFTGGAGGAGGFGGNGFGGFEDIFSQFFGGGFGGGGGIRQNRPIDGEDITMRLDITFEESVHGVEKTVKVYRTEKCSDCGGTGAANPNAIKECPHCHGSGVVTTTQNTIFGRQTVRSKCPHCGGTGKVIIEKCRTCHGTGSIKKERVIPITIPAGIDNGQTITLYGEGETGSNGGQNGKLIIVVRVKPHELFVRKGNDIYISVPVSYADLVLGCKISIPTISERNIGLTVPAGTQTGTRFAIKGYGVKYLKKDTYGDMYVTVQVDTPQKLTKEQTKLLRAFEESLTSKQTEKKKNFVHRWSTKEK